MEELQINVELALQPPNSPDMNVLDLGFFNAIQSLQHTAALKNIDELIIAVKDSFDNMNHSKLNDIFFNFAKSNGIVHY